MILGTNGKSGWAGKVLERQITHLTLTPVFDLNDIELHLYIFSVDSIATPRRMFGGNELVVQQQKVCVTETECI